MLLGRGFRLGTQAGASARRAIGCASMRIAIRYTSDRFGERHQRLPRVPADGSRGQRTLDRDQIFLSRFRNTRFLPHRVCPESEGHPCFADGMRIPER